MHLFCMALDSFLILYVNKSTLITSDLWKCGVGGKKLRKNNLQTFLIHHSVDIPNIQFNRHS